VRKIVYIVLAAGASSRMGFDKVFEPLEGRSPLERIASALGERDAFVVVPPERIDDAVRQAPLALTIVNDQPARGMSYSLKVALNALPPDRHFAVLLGDMPLVDEPLLEAIERGFGDEADVAYPVDAGGQPGHPVLFAARARAAIAALPDGDTLSTARDAQSLARVAIPYEHRGAFVDLDDPSDWNGFSKE